MTLQEVIQQATVAQPKHNHAVIAVWALSAIVIAQAITIWILIKARGGWDYLANIPITNLRSIVAIALFAISIVGTGLVGYLAGVWPPEYIFDSTLIAVTTWAGIEVTAVWLKRRTTDPSIPSRQNVQSGISGTREYPAAGQVTTTVTTEVSGDPIPGTAVPPRPVLTDIDKGRL